MKYHELERKLRAAGCFPLDSKKKVKHPMWHSPITDQDFKMSHHGSEEVKPGTLRSILETAGV